MMLPTSSRGIVHLAALLSIAVGAVSCGGAPRREPLLQDIAKLPRLSKGLLVEIHGDLPNPYGTKEEWAETIVQLFQEVGVSEVVWNAATPPGYEADMTVRIVIKTQDVDDVGSPKTDEQGAFLGVLSWITIPFLPLWIYDVEVDPGLNVQLSLRHRGDNEDDDQPQTLSLANIATNMLDRHPFLSWQTLSMLVVPAVVHRHGNPKHLARAIANEVRLEVAARAAAVVKKSHLSDGQLIQDVDLNRTEGEWELSFKAREDLGRLTLFVDGRRIDVRKVGLDRDFTKRIAYRISRAEVRNGRQLKIEAISRADGGLNYHTKRPHPTRTP